MPLIKLTTPALGQEQLTITQTEAEHVIEPNGAADDFHRKEMAMMQVGWRLHPAILA
jgi:hypothetical protein